MGEHAFQRAEDVGQARSRRALTFDHPMLRLQRSAGNAAVAQAVAQREDAAEEDLSGVGLKTTLEGSPAVQRKTSEHVKTSVIEGPVTTLSLPGDDIVTTHGRPGAVGWTTPRFETKPGPSISAQMADFVSTVSFDMELASEYTGTRGQVLKDHEQGHVRIGMLRARQHLENELHDGLAALPRPFTNTAAQGVMNTIETAFKAGEGGDSKKYDDDDYPRMSRAYEGARTSMATYASKVPAMQELADALRSFTMQAAGSVGASADNVVAKRAAVTQDQVDALQYQPEFQGVLDKAKAHAIELRSGSNVLDADTSAKVSAAETSWADLTFSAQRAVRKAL